MALNKLRRYISSSTIIVGHSLDSDFKCLKLVHHRVIDTAALYPHPKGAPFKLGLKNLAFDYLGLEVQTSGKIRHYLPIIYIYM